ncbi:MAG TPA: hypothetical protein VLR27_07790 [Acidimicrobiales bacterium]|nr:hypothetical protein [Acidimicrobiales bacterium]
MERRKAITAAAAVSLTLLAGGAGMALSSNIVGTGANDGVGQLSPVSSLDNPPITVYVDDPADPNTAVTVQATDAAPQTTSSASGHNDDDEYEDGDHDEYEDDDEHEDDDDHEEYEGGEDDD